MPSSQGNQQIPQDENAMSRYLQSLTQTITLANGRQVLIRPILPRDAEIEKAFIHGLSPRSKYLRFMGSLDDLSPEMVDWFTQIDFTQHMALIAVVEEHGNEREIAVGRYFGGLDNGGCELALVVDDQWQGRGIGRFIVGELIRDAGQKGYTWILVEIFADNLPMIKLVGKMGFQLKTQMDDARIVQGILTLKSPAEDASPHSD